MTQGLPMSRTSEPKRSIPNFVTGNCLFCRKCNELIYNKKWSSSSEIHWQYFSVKLEAILGVGPPVMQAMEYGCFLLWPWSSTNCTLHLKIWVSELDSLVTELDSLVKCTCCTLWFHVTQPLTPSCFQLLLTKFLEHSLNKLELSFNFLGLAVIRKNTY